MSLPVPPRGTITCQTKVKGAAESRIEGMRRAMCGVGACTQTSSMAERRALVSAGSILFLSWK